VKLSLPQLTVGQAHRFGLSLQPLILSDLPVPNSQVFVPYSPPDVFQAVKIQKMIKGTGNGLSCQRESN
jgi:hypothetical protein